MQLSAKRISFLIVKTILASLVFLCATMAFVVSLQLQAWADECEVATASSNDLQPQSDYAYTGTWGTCYWEYDSAEKTLTIHPGTGADTAGVCPWGDTDYLLHRNVDTSFLPRKTVKKS